MQRPDFAHADLERLTAGDLRLILEAFPAPARGYSEIAGLIETLPPAMASALGSEWLFQRIFESREEWLEISPFLLFCVLLHRYWPEPPRGDERKVVFYLANLLSLFVPADRVYRVQPQEKDTHAYIIDLIAESVGADSNRQFLIHSHIGNYALFLAGVFPRWITHRHRFKHRPLNLRSYADFGSGYFQQAATHRLAREYRLDGVFMRLAMLFDRYRLILNCLSDDYLQPH